MHPSKFLDPRNDFAFKKIFGSEKNKDIIIHFLNDVLSFDEGADIVDIHFLKTVQDPEINQKKQSIVDILCTDQKGRQIIVEMQVAHNKGFAKRAQFYASRAYCSQMNKGEPYEGLKEVIFLAVTDFLMFPEKADFKSDHIILDKKSKEHDLKDFSFTFIELPKFNKSLEDLETMLDKWAYFFKHAYTSSPEETEKLIGEDNIMERAHDELNQFNWSADEVLLYEREQKSLLDAQAIISSAKDTGRQEGKEEGLKEGEEIGLKKGKEEGKEEAKNTFALNLMKMGMNNEKIAELTDLSIDSVQNLR